MKTTDQTFDSLDDLFRSAHDSEPHLADDGFSDRVIEVLPAHRGLRGWQKNGLILGSAALGSGIAITLMPGFELPIRELIPNLSSVSLTATTLLAGAAIITVLCGTALWASHKEII